MKVIPTTIGLLLAAIESGNILPRPGIRKIVSVIVALAIAATIAAGIPLTTGIAAFLKICLREFYFSDNPFARANLI